MRFSSRASRLGESATLKVAQRARELRAAGVEVVDLSAGEPDFASPPAAVSAARQALADGFTKYTPAAGIPELRQALADRYRELCGAPWKSPQVLVSVGAKSGLFELALALFDEGDEVILPSPYWVSFPEYIRFAGASPVTVECSVEDGFLIHADAILEALTPSTRAVLLNSPCNPTGGVVAAGDLEAIVEACAGRGILLLSDETYERFVYDGAPFATAAALASRFPETVVLVGSFSKAYAMTGWRVGFALGPDELIRKAAAIQSHATSNPTSFAMVGALAALREAEAEVEAMIAEYQERRDLVSRGLAEIPGVELRPPAGAFYAFPRCADCYRVGRRGSVALAEFLL
ncbi:MAG: aminotransferase class I/II-fold pyridoxal phosphate-dependent enzyme [Thermoanaerobaculia bacterium]